MCSTSSLVVDASVVGLVTGYIPLLMIGALGAGRTAVPVTGERAVPVPEDVPGFAARNAFEDEAIRTTEIRIDEPDCRSFRQRLGEMCGVSHE